MAAGRAGLGGLSWVGLGGLGCAGLLCDALRSKAPRMRTHRSSLPLRPSHPATTMLSLPPSFHKPRASVQLTSAYGSRSSGALLRGGPLFFLSRVAHLPYRVLFPSTYCPPRLTFVPVSISLSLMVHMLTFPHCVRIPTETRTSLHRPLTSPFVFYSSRFQDRSTFPHRHTHHSAPCK